MSTDAHKGVVNEGLEKISEKKFLLFCGVQFQQSLRSAGIVVLSNVSCYNIWFGVFKTELDFEPKERNTLKK